MGPRWVQVAELCLETKALDSQFSACLSPLSSRPLSLSPPLPWHAPLSPSPLFLSWLSSLFLSFPTESLQTLLGG